MQTNGANDFPPFFRGSRSEWLTWGGIESKRGAGGSFKPFVRGFGKGERAVKKSIIWWLIWILAVMVLFVFLSAFDRGPRKHVRGLSHDEAGYLPYMD